MAHRRYNSEVSALIDLTVSVVTVDNKTYTGTLIGVNPSNLSLVLADSKDPEGRIIPKVVLSGGTVAQILSIEKAFDLKGLAERLERVFPRMVKLYEKEGFIWVIEGYRGRSSRGIRPGSREGREGLLTVRPRDERRIDYTEKRIEPES